MNVENQNIKKKEKEQENFYKNKMDIREAQAKIRKFDEDRGWKDSWNLKDLMLNINEEVGEMWNLVKWVGEKDQKRIVNEKKEEVSDFIGDSMFLLLKIANQTNVNSEKALENTLAEFEERMPAEKMKEVGHANKLSGGIDNKK